MPNPPQKIQNRIPPALTFATGRLAVDDPTKHPEFIGNVKSGEARGFWREGEVWLKPQDDHCNRHAETFMEVGNALGRVVPKPFARVLAE